jgi:EXLDI family protein
METITLDRSGMKDLRFEGEEIASAEIDGGTGRGQSIAIYRTAKGQIVGYVETWSRWQDEDSLYAAEVLSDAQDGITLFGLSKEAKELLKAAGLEAVETID